ncbi:signal peptidase I [Salinibacterium sp. G-O1]|uniref:signal peptidase I n=1 Tax=Salinibacterium sp. G-O1 TaxID=3046208 RepID=UPI0024B8E584|nr:signal peptidase I [Salinibacterium sp. G-O1]MDJ0335652.1 signal peptidase I [Salinibacterium sp. G-O1]
MAAREGGGTGEPVEGDPKEKSLLHYLGLALSGALLVMVLVIAVLVIAAPAIVGGSALTVLTNSMAPKFPPGTLIVIKPTPIDEIKVGDVLTYQIKSGNPAVISHRVITRSVSLEGETTFITKGDNNDLADPKPIMEVQVKGTLWYAIPYLGFVNNAVNGETRPLVTPIIAGLLFAYAVYTVISSIAGRRKRRDDDVSPLVADSPDSVAELVPAPPPEPEQYDPDLSR